MSNPVQKEFPRTQEERTKKERVRGVFNGTQMRMDVTKTPELEGYVIRWMNDLGNNIRLALSGGWELVGKDEVEFNDAGSVMHRNESFGNAVALTAGANGDGSGMTAYLMKIKQEWYDEDKLAYQQRCDAVMEPIRSGKGKESEFEGRYVPNGESRASTFKSR